MSEPTADDIPDIQDLVSEIGEDPSEIAEIIAEDVVDPNTLPTHAQRAMLSALLVEAVERLYADDTTLQEAFTRLMEERSIGFTTGSEGTIEAGGLKISGKSTISGDSLTVGTIDSKKLKVISKNTTAVGDEGKEKNDTSRKDTK